VTSQRELGFVSFQARNGEFIAYLPLEDLSALTGDPEAVLRKAAATYERSVAKMRTLADEIRDLQRHHKTTPARKVWQLGDIIWDLNRDLARISLQVDALYEHLVRDLGVKRKWLEKVVILRRYIPDENLIPENLNWGRCEKGTRKVAERIRDGLPLQ